MAEHLGKLLALANRCGVGQLGAQVRVLNPQHRFTATEAKVHAAWLVKVAEAADPAGPAFDQVLEAVRRGE